MDEQNATYGSLTIHSSIIQRRLSADLAGYLDSETVQFLCEFLQNAFTDLAAGVVNDIEFTTAQLHLMSSSAITCLARWVGSVSERFPNSRITFHTDHQRTWQRRAFGAIQGLAPRNVVVD